VQLILHIGTHKTGTSALQACLLRNERVLAQKGIHYARVAPYKNCNVLAKLVAKTPGVEAKAFMHRQLEKANKIGANILVVSAEAFYAMTFFFHKFNNRGYRDYWDRESASVEFLHRALGSELTTRLIVFFRRQDQFLESIYRQLVQSRGLAMPIREFKIFSNEALDYWGHMELWGAAFPNCQVYTYDEVSGNICDFFLRNVLNITDTEEFEGLDSRLNIRFSRDLLEYKRMLNSQDTSDVDRYMSNLACLELARALNDDGRFQDYLAPSDRMALLDEVKTDNALLNGVYGMKPFPIPSVDSLTGWAPYPGLSKERARELAERHARIRSRADYRIERLALMAREHIQHRLPLLAWMIPLGRSLLPKHRNVQ
jgi:hypothetical protein